jgi:hypothetical protein
MAIRIQLRRDTAANWTSSNPVLRAGELGIETDTLKFKIGNGSSTWTQITSYANITPTGLSNSLGSYILSADQGNPGGPAELDSNGDLVVPENSVILWNDDAHTYSTTLTATQPTADRTITFPNATGTVALTTDITAAVDAITTDVIEEGSTNKYFTDERAQDAVSTALAAGTHTNITVTYNDSANSISLAAAPGYVDEQAVDAVATALAAGTHTNITVGYNDAGNAISLTGAVTYTDENAQDAVGNAVGTGLSYNDTTGAISVDTSTIQARVTDVSDTEIGYLNGVTSAIQTQLDDKELNYVDGVTSAIQTQLDAKVDESIITAKGDLYVGSSSATLDNLAVGSNGYLLTADSAEPLGVKWAAAPVSLPSQTGNSGEYLTTDGTNASWAAIPVTSAATHTALGTVYGKMSDETDPNAVYTALGYNALASRTSGGYIVAVGHKSLYNAISSSDSVAIGSYALFTTTTGYQNVAVGPSALTNSTGYGNVALGHISGRDLATGNYNTFLGWGAGYNDSTAWSGSNNILIGKSPMPSTTTTSNEIVIGNTDNNRFRIPGIGLDFGKTSTLSSNTATTIDSIALTSFTSAEYLLSLKQGSKVRTSKVIVQDDGTNVDMTEFAITETGGTMSGVVVSAAASSGNAVLQLTVTDAATTNVTVKLSKVVL